MILILYDLLSCQKLEVLNQQIKQKLFYFYKKDISLKKVNNFSIYFSNLKLAHMYLLHTL